MKMAKLMAGATALILLTQALCGCDMVRSIMGRPTSADIERMKAEKLASEKQKAAERDSIERAAADSAALAAAASKAADVLNCRYYVIAGAFLVPENADKYTERLRKSGYEVTRFKFKSGFSAVALFGSDDMASAKKQMDTFMEGPLAAWDVWVYDTAEHLHE